jgi:hypothetical protein
MTSIICATLLLGVIPPDGELVAARPEDPTASPTTTPEVIETPEIVGGTVPIGGPTAVVVPMERFAPMPAHCDPTAQPRCMRPWGILGGRPLIPRYPVYQGYYRTHGYDLYRALDYPWNPPPAWKRRGERGPHRPEIYHLPPR